MVGREGIEPPQSKTADLQSAELTTCSTYPLKSTDIVVHCRSDAQYSERLLPSQSSVVVRRSMPSRMTRSYS